MKILTIALLMAGSLVSASCSNVKYEAGKDLAGYKTWSWYLPELSEPVSLYDKALRAELAESFNNKGYRYVLNPSDADFLVKVSKERRKYTRTLPPQQYVVGHYHQDGTYHHQYRDGTTEVHHPDEGKIVAYDYAYSSSRSSQYSRFFYGLDVYDELDRPPFWSNKVADNSVKSDLQLKVRLMAKRLNKFPSADSKSN